MCLLQANTKVHLLAHANSSQHHLATILAFVRTGIDLFSSKGQNYSCVL